MNKILNNTQDYYDLIDNTFVCESNEKALQYPCLAVGSYDYQPYAKDGFHYEFVPLLKDGDRYYINEDK